jgi:carboxyl-terminal processing protease
MPRQIVTLYAGWILPIAVALLIAANHFGKATAGGEDADAGLARLRIVHAVIQERYVHPVESDTLVEGALHGMLGSLDDYSVYFDPKEFREFMDDTNGAFGGIGVEIELRQGWLTVITPIEDTPAARAGIRAGDTFLAIDGESAEGITLQKAVGKLRGREGTPVRLKMLHRGDKEPVELTVVRDLIHVASVKGTRMADAEAKIGYVRLTTFQDGSSEEFAKAVESLRSQGLKALVVDLRFNGGGLLDEAVALADLFLEDGVIVSTRGRRAADQRISRAERKGTLPPMPLALLVNEASASASEVLAGALRDHGLAVLVGERTYGKGSVQTVIPLREYLPGEADGAGIKITTAHYFTPSGVNISRIEGKKEFGLEPDALVEMSDAEEFELFSRRDGEPDDGGKPVADPQLDRAVGILRGKLGLPVPEIRKADLKPDAPPADKAPDPPAPPQNTDEPTK